MNPEPLSPSTPEKNAGLALVVFVCLLVATMVLHPVGGSFEYLLRITPMIVGAHTIALLSLPFGLLGFRGLTRTVGQDNFFSSAAFAFIVFGLVAVMIAAATNGLVLTQFIGRYEGASQETIAALKPFLRYTISVNHAFDFITAGAFGIAMLFWSVAILQNKRFPAWIAWLGIVLSITGVILIASGTALATLQGFRVYVTSMVVWIVIVGIRMTRQKESKQ